MKRLFKILISLLLTLAMLCSLCCCEIDKNKLTVENDSDFTIVTTIFPYFDFTKNIVGDKANVKMLLSPGAEVHNFEPSPSDIIAIENCDLFIYNGGESDVWVEKILDSLEGKVTVLKMFDYVDLHDEDEIELEADEEGHDHDHEHEHHHHEDGEEEEEYDEHIWTSPKNALSLSNAIAKTLCQIDSSNKEYYEQSFAKYKAELTSLDENLRSIVENGKRKEIVVGDRFPFLYFVKEYDLEYHCAFPGCSSETEPSVKTVTSLINVVRDEEIPVVFYLEMSSQATAKIISEDTNAKTLMLHSCQNITKDEAQQGETYISIMTKNAERLREALN